MSVRRAGVRHARGLVGNGVCLRELGRARGRAPARVSGARVFMCGGTGARGRGARSCSAAALSFPSFCPPARAPRPVPPRGGRSPAQHPRCKRSAPECSEGCFVFHAPQKVEREGVEELPESLAYLQPRSRALEGGYVLLRRHPCSTP